MASPVSGTSSGSSSLQNGDDHLQADQRKHKRMLSSRESARRSRMRRQKLLDDLTVQINNLRAENSSILTNINLATHLYLNMESQNSVLRARMSELNHRLGALEEIISSNTDPAPRRDDLEDMISGWSDDFLNPWSLIHFNHPIMASPDVLLS